MAKDYGGSRQVVNQEKAENRGKSAAAPGI
jgi:hypothetical protein